MSKVQKIQNAEQLAALKQSERVVVIDFYADWCAPCKRVAPLFTDLAEDLARPGVMAFVQVDVDAQQEIARAHRVTAMPTFVVFRRGREVERVTGGDPTRLLDVTMKLREEAEKGEGREGEEGDKAGQEGGGGGGGGTTGWLASQLPRGYVDVTDEVDLNNLDVLNASTAHGTSRTLFEATKPATTGARLESDTDEQMLIYVPFKSTLKVHTLQLHSSPNSNNDDDDAPGRPKTIKLFTNRAHNLSFDEAESVPATQEITLDEAKYDAHGTISVPLFFVRFQSVTSLVVFIVDAHGGRETVRLDRLRFVGQAGEKRDPGKLQKVEHGE